MTGRGAGPEGRRAWRFGLYAGAWAFVGVLFVVPLIAQALAERRGVPWSRVTSDLLCWGIWGLLLPPIWWLSRRFPWRRDRLLHWIPIHLAGGLAISAVFVVLLEVKDGIVAALFDAGAPFSPLGPSGGTVSSPLGLPGGTVFNPLADLPGYLYGGFEFFLLPYFAIVASVHAFGAFQRRRRRELNVSRLETRLVQAHLEVLKMQLRPHFLFNTLNAISALMHRDVDAADRMITLLSDLLRMSLVDDERHLVALEDELEFLNRYLAIEKIRFRDRLEVELDVGSGCLAAQVPRLILQPLVENSIRHGIAMRSAAGKVAIRARRRGDRLALEVWDDGPGIPDGVLLREGVGLTNTRARLEQIYGGDHRFELANAEVGGLEVRLEIPFEEQARSGIG